MHSSRLRTFVFLAAVGVASSILVAVGLGTAGGASSGKQALPNLAYVTAQVEKARAVPKFVAPAGSVPFDPRELKGKLIFSIPTASQIPLFEAITHGQLDALKPFGLKYFEFKNQGAPSEWAKGIQQAIGQKADVILLEGPFVTQLVPQITLANRAGIPVISFASQDASVPRMKGLAGWIFFPFEKTAKLEADWVIMDSKGKANVLVVTSLDATPSATVKSAITKEFATYCGPGCTFKFIDVPIAQWAGKLQTAVQSALLADGNINYIIPIYDGMSQFAVPAVKAVGRQSKIKIVTFNGTPFVLDLIRNKDVVAMDVGEDNRCAGFANVDNIMRVLAGKKTVLNDSISIRVFDATNVAQAGKPASYDKGYGDSCAQTYRKLWGVKK